MDLLHRAADSIKSNSKRCKSLRENSSNIWRNTGVEVFARSQRNEDDEEALKWAALEKLTTFDRLRKGLLLGTEGPYQVDIDKLGFEDKRNLIERLVPSVEEDNGEFLLRLRNRLDRVGIEIPTIEVRYENLNIDAEAYSASRAVPTFVNFHINFVEKVLNSLYILPSRKKPFTILKDVSGIIKPCRMTLLLGPPSSGKTTLLLALAGSGRLDPAQIVNMLRQYVHIMKGTAFISLLQPAPETYDLFDDIVLLSDGQIVYQGPRENVLEFFEAMGFKCPERKQMADFQKRLEMMPRKVVL